MTDGVSGASASHFTHSGMKVMNMISIYNLYVFRLTIAVIDMKIHLVMDYILVVLLEC